MKGKVEAVTTQQTQDTLRYEVNLTVTIRKGLTYKRSEELLASLQEEYLGKMVDITLSETNSNNQA